MSHSLVPGPSSPLAPFVASIDYYESALPSKRERVLPSGRMSLMVNLYEDEFRTYADPVGETVTRYRGAILGGPQAHSTVIDTDEQRCLVSVNFKLGGSVPFFDVPPAETCDRLVELEDLWGCDGTALRERLLAAPIPVDKLRILEGALLDHMRQTDPDAGVAWSLAALEQGRTVSHVAADLGLLPKRFLLAFRGRIGLAPKQYARVRRLQRVVSSVAGSEAVDWADVAVDHGYYDQSHLINDFRELAGITPTAYQPRAVHEHNHVPIAQE